MIPSLLAGLGVAIVIGYGLWLVHHTQRQLHQHLETLVGKRVRLQGDRTCLRRMEGQVESVTDFDVVIVRDSGTREYVALSAIHWVSEPGQAAWARYRPR